MTLPWEYVPDEDQIVTYTSIYSKYYGGDAITLWNQALAAAKSKIDKEIEIVRVFKEYFWNVENKPVMIYGAGHNAKVICEIGRRIGINIVGCVISDNQSVQKAYNDIPVYRYSDIPAEYFEALIIISFTSREIADKLKTSGRKYMELPYQLVDLLNIL